MSETKSILQLARERRSVRTFTPEPLSKEQLETIRGHVASIREPFSGRVSFKLLDADRFSLSSPVVKGAKQYIAICAKKSENAELAAGYAGEDLFLFLCGMGIGTVWIGGTMDRAAFEKASALKEDEIMVCITPAGCPAKMSLRENMMRKGVKADQRKKTEEIFEDRCPVDHSLAQDVYRDAVEAVRLAPSAVNRQHWYIIHDQNGFHFFLKRSMKKSDSLDMQKVDMGIALYHFCAVLDENNIAYRTEQLNEQEEGLEYILSVIPEQ